MNISNRYYKLQFDENYGTVTSFNNYVKEYIAAVSSNRPLFTIRFRNDSGEAIDISCLEALKFSIALERCENRQKLTMCYHLNNIVAADVCVKVSCPDDEAFTYWNLSIDYDPSYAIEWIDFPGITVHDDLISSGGKSRVFWPAMEGCLIEDSSLRDSTWLKYSQISYPSKGWEGYYPGPCPMQFMAYYEDRDRGGLYIGAHDDECNVKAIEFYRNEDGIKLEYRLFPGVAGSGFYKMEYNMVIGVFSGDWYDAADIYRNWFESSKLSRLPKLYENKALPEWVKDSPIVVTYPVRGVKDTGDMLPNEYFPYTNALSYIDRLSEELESRILVLLMHWEGTAPWSPPYVWPPYGGEELFLEFVGKLHEKGNLIGVYCSGIGWTNESVLVPEYNRKTQFEEQNLREIMCAAPDGSVPHALICNGPIRWGHDMCPSNEFVVKTVVGEVSKIIGSGCDYIQYFDQNLGGASYFCYSKKHGHPPVPGKWQKEAMLNLFGKLDEVVKKSEQKTLIGCESAAAEPYIGYLLFNDLRFNINYFYGKPVPAYSYIYHEYTNNFMGNQNSSCAAISINKSPDNLLFRLAYSFTAGDLLTVVLKNGGKIHWDWGTEWTVEEVDEKAAKALIRNLNAWRRGAAAPFLRFGRMVKPYDLTEIYETALILNSGHKHVYPSLLSSRWLSCEGKDAQIVINYTREAQEFGLAIKDKAIRYVRVYDKPYEEKNTVFTQGLDTRKLRVEPLEVVMLEFVY